MPVTFEISEYKNFGKCLTVSDGRSELEVTLDIGPRVISYSLCGHKNIFSEDIERKTFRGGGQLHSFFGNDENWYIYGGHRLWSSPESFPESYTPDNFPVEYVIDEAAGSVTLTPPDRTQVGERHSMKVTMSVDGSVTVSHTITNISGGALKLAPWCMTVGEKNGTLIIPQSRDKTGLLSNRHISVWEYTDVSDPRFFLGNRYMTLRQQPGSQNKFKIGINNTEGWSAYLAEGQLFRKAFAWERGEEYPDNGCNFEAFTDGEIIEIESLGFLKELAPGESVFAEEKWSLTACPDSFDPRDEDNIDAFVRKYGLDE